MDYVSLDGLMKSKDSVYLALIRATSFHVYSTYHEILRGEGTILSDLVGDPYKFLGIGKYNTHGLMLKIGVGSEDIGAIYRLSFDWDNIYISPSERYFRRIETEYATCTITGVKGICYRYKLELIDHGIINREHWIPYINFDAQVKHQNKRVKIVGTQASTMCPWQVNYRIVPIIDDKSRIYVYAKDLAILADDETYVPIMDYARSIRCSSPPALNDDGMPTAYWGIHWPEGHWAHCWAHGYAQRTQSLPIKKYWE